MRKFEESDCLFLVRILAGPFTTMLLGDLGAEIIKIEKPGNIIYQIYNSEYCISSILIGDWFTQLQLSVEMQ